MTDVPTKVASALAERRHRQAPVANEQTSTSGIATGDLRAIEGLAHQPADRRLGLVLRIDPSNEFADVLLVHSSPELATDRDAIVAANVASAPYDVVVQTDLRAVVWTLQLRRRVGHLDEQSLDAVRAVANDAAAHVSTSQTAIADARTWVGSPLAGPLDGRWSFKESEGTALRRLAADCTEALLDQGLVWQVSSHLLRPELLSHVDDHELLLTEFHHWERTRSLSVDNDDLELLLEEGALDPDAWANVSDIGADILISVQQVALRAATGADEQTDRERGGLLAAAGVDVTGHAETIDRIHYLGARQLVAA